MLALTHAFGRQLDECFMLQVAQAALVALHMYITAARSFTPFLGVVTPRPRAERARVRSKTWSPGAASGRGYVLGAMVLLVFTVIFDRRKTKWMRGGASYAHT